MTEADAERRRWPIVAAFITVWLRPATTARRLAHVSLLRAWLFHVAVGVVSVAFISLLIVWADLDWMEDLSVLMRRYWRHVVAIGDDFRRRPLALATAIGAAWLAVEAGLLLLALVVMPWGAGDEPLRRSYRHALRQVWLQCAQVIACAAVVGATGRVLHEAGDAWKRANPKSALPVAPTVPAVSPSHASYQRAMAEYRAAQDQYFREVNRRVQATPWYVEHPQPIVIHMGFVTSLWLLWGLLRGVGARRTIPLNIRPPTCEFCGYNLTGMPLESRCPECGEPVVASLGPDVRPGALWEKRQQIGRLKAWWQTCSDIILQPTAFGRRLRLIPAGTHQRRFFAIHLPMIYLIGAVGAANAVLAGAGVDELLREPEATLAAMSAFGCVCAIGAVMFTLLGATLVGVIDSLREKRNLLPGVMQAACCLGAYLVAWALFGGTSGVIVIALGRAGVFRALGILVGIDQFVLAFLVWFVPNAVLCVAYFGLLARATTAMRYANR